MVALTLRRLSVRERSSPPRSSRPSRARRVGCLDLRAEEHALGRPLPRGGAGLAPVRREAGDRAYLASLPCRARLCSKTVTATLRGAAARPLVARGGRHGGATSCPWSPSSCSARPRALHDLVERNLVGAEGAAFDRTFVERAWSPAVPPGSTWASWSGPGARLHLSALAGQPGRLVAVRYPRRRWRRSPCSGASRRWPGRSLERCSF